MRNMSSFRLPLPNSVSSREMDAACSEKTSKLEDLENPSSAIFHAKCPPVKIRAARGQVSLVLKLLFLGLCLTLTLLYRPLITKHVTLAYKAILQNDQAHHSHTNCHHDSDLFTPDAAPPWPEDPVKARPLDRATWAATCSSQEDDPNRACTNAVAGKGSRKFWQSKTGTTHWIMVDLGKPQNVHSLAMLPSRTGADGGMPKKHLVQVATEQSSWVTVATGEWRNDPDEKKFATFEPLVARYVNLTIIDTTKGTEFVAIGDVDIYGVEQIHPSPPNGGRWGITINFPLVPVTAFLNPLTHKLITMSAFKENGFGEGKGKQTWSVTWDPKTGAIDETLITSTNHDMFCPGTSFDEKGSVIVTGGDTPDAFSIYDSTKNEWTVPKDKRLAIGRGYQGQTFLPNGKTFMIGGGWSNTNKDKNGEVYDPKTQTWQELPNARAEFMKMDEVIACADKPKWDENCKMSGWRQHHAWLFAWKNGSILHAGPSKKMNWYFTEPAGGAHKDAGLRGDSPDAVCGVTSMYDAEKGTILTAGGSRNYHYWVNVDKAKTYHRDESSREAFELKLGEGGEPVTTTKLKPMTHQRIFANGVIYPNGETLVVGGQIQGEPFYDETWQPIPEVYSPSTGTWREVARHSTPRGYHSWALLLPDASVIVGGAGLNDDSKRSKTNHYDAQIYYPGYLFKADGKTFTERPKITAIDNKQAYKVGGKITITTDSAVHNASLIRYSAATHALNNDLRRIQLTLTTEGDASKNTYSVKIPEDPGVTLPGYWMLFVLRDEVPSHAETVQILAN